MNQVRFRIGIPRAGSAAETSEREEKARPFSRASMAGSAAREAEERRRAGVQMDRTPNWIALRAFGATAADDLDAVATTRKAAQTEHFSETDRATTLRATDSGAHMPERHNGNVVLPALDSGASHTIASRLSSLTRSLFSRDTNG